jgi:hypothetical protein
MIGQSPYFLGECLFEKSLNETHLIQSFDNVGIISPVILYKDGTETFHLIDGKKRIQFAKEQQLKTVYAVVLPEVTKTSDIIRFFLNDKRDDINDSVINKVQFICFALSLKVSEPWILENLCIPMCFRPHSKFLIECGRINNLPKEIKLFCHEKRFSMKQILNLTYFPEELLTGLITWKSEMQLTASILDEIASNLKDYLKSNDKTVKEFFSEPDVQEVIGSSLNAREKTDRIRHLIHLKRFPTLSKINSEIQKAVEHLNIPKEITINWDKSLENKNINVSLHVNNMEKWTKILNKLKSVDIKHALDTILEKL